MPRGGLDSLLRESIRRGYWREKEGLIAKKWERVTKVTARLDDFAPDPMVSGRFQVNVTPEDADTIFVSEAGPPDQQTATKLDGRIYETAAPAAWFLAVDSTGAASTGDVCEWRAPLRIKLDAKRNASSWRLSLQGLPRAANIRISFDGTDPRNAPPVSPGEIDAPNGATQVRALVELEGKFSFEETARLAPAGFEFDPNAQTTPVKPDSPATMTS